MYIRRYKRKSKPYFQLFFVLVLLLMTAPVIASIIITILLMFFLVRWIIKGKKQDSEISEHNKEISNEYLPYKKKDFLLTKAEYNFDKVLMEAVQDKYYIGRQVPLSNLVDVTTAYKPYRSKIDKKTIDFVLFNKAGYTPYLAIELDDSSHNRLDRIQRDEFVEDVLTKAGIRIVRVKNAYNYNVDTIAGFIG